MNIRTFFPALLYGLLTILFIIVSTSVVVSLLLSFTKMTEHSVSWLITTVAFVALFLGGAIAGMKAKKNGWLIGASTALAFSILTFFIQYVGYDSAFTLKQYVIHSGYIICALIGGMVSVNLFYEQS